MDVSFWIWLSVIIVALVVELATLDLVSIWFSIGAIAPFVMSCFGIAIWIEIIVFVVVSALLIVLLRKVTLRMLQKGSEGKTNTEAFKGQTRKLLDDITFDDDGAVRFNGVVWTATTADRSEIKAGNYVDVLRVEGNKLIVKLSDKQPGSKTSTEAEEKEEKKNEPIVEEKGE